MSRLAYFVRETLISLRRNLLMTLAGILTVSVSLCLFGGVLLVSRIVDHGTSRWKHGVQLEIFMQPNATANQIKTVRNQLTSSPDVKSIRYLNHQDAYNEFKRIFNDQPVMWQNITPDELPPSFRVVPVSPQRTQRIDDAFRNVPGVKQVNTAEKQVKSLLTTTSRIRLAFFVLAGALLVSSLFLIVNTIRLATFARRREIEVMKLVGASNWFVRVPFMAEGLVQGAIGSGFAVGLVYALKVILTNWLHHSQTLFSPFYANSHDLVVIAVLVLVIGSGIGVAGSALGLRSFLEG